VDASNDVGYVTFTVHLDDNFPEGVDLQQPGGLGGLDVLAVPDDVLVVGPAARCRAREQTGDRTHRGYDERHGVVDPGDLWVCAG
jgi:hypothetical protein